MTRWTLKWCGKPFATICPISTSWSRPHQIKEDYETETRSIETKLRRDSISRKLCGGSTAVTVEDLAQWETELSNTKIALQNLLKDTPIFARHPTFAAATGREN
jgi:hypothetical protein